MFMTTAQRRHRRFCSNSLAGGNALPMISSVDAEDNQGGLGPKMERSGQLAACSLPAGASSLFG